MLMPDFSSCRHELIMAYDAPVVHRSAQRQDYVDNHYANWWVRRGTVTVRHETGQLQAGVGDCLLLDPGYRRDQHFSSDAVIVSVRVNVEWQGLGMFAPPGEPILLCGEQAEQLLEPSTALVGLWSACQSAPDSVVDLCRLRSGFHHWLGCWYAIRQSLGRGPSLGRSTDARLYRVLEVLQEYRLTGPTPYGQLQKAVGLSRSQIDRLLVSAFGLTPQRWREKRCLSAAEQLLADPAMSIKQVAGRLGFVDASHFAKWFARRMQMAPSEYRRLGRASRV